MADLDTEGRLHSMHVLVHFTVVDRSTWHCTFNSMLDTGIKVVHTYNWIVQYSVPKLYIIIRIKCSTSVCVCHCLATEFFTYRISVDDHMVA